jgi:hypothetical protein
MPDAHVAGDHLAGVHAGAILQPDAVDLLELSVDPDEFLLHLGGGPHRAERVVLVEPGEAEHGHDCVADVLLDGPAVPL